MGRLNKVVRTGRRQDGFTLAEVLIAVLLMAISSIGLLAMFDSSLQLSSLARKSKDAKRIARTVSERIRAMPFYGPYTDKDVDVDDSFWGTAAQRGGTATPDITKNDWVNAPYLDFPQDLDPRYTCQVKMAYVLDDLTTLNMKADWVPKASAAEGGKDKPLSVNSDVFHIIKYEVKVSWEARLSGGRTADKSESYTTLMSDTEFQAELGVSAISNISISFLRWGTGGHYSNTAPHNVNNVEVQITGYGFKAGPTITASLARQGVDDIPIYNVVRYVAGGHPDNNLRGWVDLATNPFPTQVGVPPWQPRRDPGKWTVRVDVGPAYAFANEAFVVEFPGPKIDSSKPRYGYDNQGPGSLDACLTAGGSNVLNLGAGSSPYTSYTGATIILVKVEDPNVMILPDPDMLISYPDESLYPRPSGYGITQHVQAYFDLRGAILGDYYVEIANCKNNRVTLKPGDVTSRPDSAYLFTIRRVPVITEFPGPADSTRTTGITAGSDGNIWFAKDNKPVPPALFGKKPVGRIIPALPNTITDYTVSQEGAIPQDITAGPDGKLWFTETYAGKIGRITTAGVCDGEFAIPGVSFPRDITAGPDGKLWFTGLSANRIGRITTAGHCDFDDVFAIDSLGGVGFWGITAGPDGNLWFTADNANKIERITTAGHCDADDQFAITAGSTPRGITVGPDGNLWFCEYSANKIGRMNPTTHVVKEFTIPTPNSGPTNITVGPDGNLWFTEFLGNKIGCMDINGNCGSSDEFTIPTANSGPFDLTAGPDGFGNIGIWFTESLGNKIGRIVISGPM